MRNQFIGLNKLEVTPIRFAEDLHLMTRSKIPALYSQ